MRKSNGLPAGTGIFKPVRLGAGGETTGFSQSTDGVTSAVRIDVNGAYVKSTGDSVWRLAFSSASLAAADTPYGTGYVAPNSSLIDTWGCNEIVVAPNDNQRLYAVWNARLWKSTNAGNNWTHLTAMADFLAQANAGITTHNAGPNIAVDPQNHDVFLLGTAANGLNYSTNGGTTITNVALGTNATFNGYQSPSKVACDPTGSVVSTVKQRWFAWLQGTGGYVSTAGPGGPYTLMTGSPTYAADIVFDASGGCWVIDPSNSTTCNLWYCSPGTTTWTRAPGSCPSTGQLTTVAVDPHTSGTTIRVIAFSNGVACVSSNTATSWLGNQPYNATISGRNIVNVYPYTIPWLGQAPWGGSPAGFVGCCARFDNSASNKLWMTTGLGVQSCQAPTAFNDGTAASRFDWQESSEGIENLVATDVIEPTGSSPIFSVWDQAVWRMDDLDHSPRSSNRIPGNGFGNGSVQACWETSCAYDNPQYVVGLIHFNGDYSGYSTDGWKTCNLFPTPVPPSPLGGSICTGLQNQILIAPVSCCPFYSKDGGNTWGIVNVAGMPTSAVFIGSISGTTLTVTSVISGTIAVGQTLYSNSLGVSETINALGTGTGGVGTYTVSNSTTLASATITGTSASGFGTYADYFRRKIACYDGLTQKYYMANFGTSGWTAGAGVWSASDLAGAWTHVKSGTIWGTADTYHMRLAWVPGQQGHFFACAGWDQNVKFVRSTDGCATFQNVDQGQTWTITQVADFAFGTPAPGKSYPTVWFYGYVSGVIGLYRSDDNFATQPKFLLQYPTNIVDYPLTLGASPNKYGRVYIGFGGSGFVYGDYDDPVTVS